MLIAKTSSLTSRTHEMEIDVSDKQIALWLEGALIQDVMPNLSPDEREFIMTGITPAEWDEAFAQSDVGPNYNGVKRSRSYEVMEPWKYIVWVGGVDDWYTTYERAKEHYDEWIEQGYDQVVIEKLENEVGVTECINVT